ncbi:MAG: hypothetical protein AABZ14_07980 [Candidatus Margulisiibacteriota bacterium]
MSRTRIASLMILFGLSLSFGLEVTANGFILDMNQNRVLLSEDVKIQSGQYHFYSDEAFLSKT